MGEPAVARGTTTRDQLARMIAVLESQEAKADERWRRLDHRLGELIDHVDSVRLTIARQGERRGFFSRLFGRGTVP